MQPFFLERKVNHSSLITPTHLVRNFPFYKGLETNKSYQSLENTGILKVKLFPIVAGFCYLQLKPTHLAMKIETAKQLILKFLMDFPEVSVQEIQYKTKVPMVQVHGVGTLLEEEGLITVIKNDKNKIFKLSAAQVKPVQSDIEPERAKQKEAPGKEPQKIMGRNLSKYQFNGEEYNKGRLALAIVKQYAQDYKPTLKAVLKQFADDVVPPYGMIKPRTEAVAISKGRPRFFIKEAEAIKIKDAIICVSNQWTSERIEELLKIAKTLKYKVKAV